MKLSTGLLCSMIWCIVSHAQLDNLRLNRIQVIGSHNSYKQAMAVLNPG